MRQEGLSGVAILKAQFGIGYLKSDMKQMMVMSVH